jgi:hypothetical protein
MSQDLVERAMGGDREAFAAAAQNDRQALRHLPTDPVRQLAVALVREPRADPLFGVVVAVHAVLSDRSVMSFRASASRAALSADHRVVQT